MLDYVKKCNDKVNLIVLINCDINVDIINGMAQACEQQNVNYIRLQNISKIDGHPDELGMEQIKEQILKHGM